MVTFGRTTAIPHILSPRFAKFFSKLVSPNFSIGGGRKCAMGLLGYLRVYHSYLAYSVFSLRDICLKTFRGQMTHRRPRHMRRCHWFTPPGNAIAHRRSRVVTFPGSKPRAQGPSPAGWHFSYHSNAFPTTGANGPLALIWLLRVSSDIIVI